MEDAFDKVFGNKQRVMIVLGHPDDLEVFAGGTVARLITEGKEVCSVKVTMGDMGSQQQKISQSELTDTRLKEDTASMENLGVKPENNIYLRFGDGMVENSLEVIKAIAHEIRRFKPDIIITHNPDDTIIRFDKDINWVNHRDHRNTGKSTIDAAYPFARDILFFPDQLAETGLASHACTEFLLVDYYDHPDMVGIDVSNFIGNRVQALGLHASQYTPEHAQSMADFMTTIPETEKRFERFRYVIAD